MMTLPVIAAGEQVLYQSWQTRSLLNAANLSTTHLKVISKQPAKFNSGSLNPLNYYSPMEIHQVLKHF